MRKLAMEYMKKMGIRDTQFIIFRHHDHDHDHVHVVYNRVNDDGKTISDGCDVERAIAICQAMTRHYGLHWSDGKKNVNRDRLKGKAAVKYAIYDAAQKALTDSHTWADFIKRMQEQGIHVKLVSRDDGKDKGIIFTKGNVSMSGSQVDRRTLTFGTLFNQLCKVNDVLPDEEKLPYYHISFEDVIAEQEAQMRLPHVSFDKSDEITEDRTVNFYGGDDVSDIIDLNAAAEAVNDVVSSAASTAVEIMMGPEVVPTVGGGGGSSSSKKDDDDDDEKKKKKGRTFHR